MPCPSSSASWSRAAGIRSSGWRTTPTISAAAPDPAGGVVRSPLLSAANWSSVKAVICTWSPTASPLRAACSSSTTTSSAPGSNARPSTTTGWSSRDSGTGRSERQPTPMSRAVAARPSRTSWPMQAGGLTGGRHAWQRGEERQVLRRRVPRGVHALLQLTAGFAEHHHRVGRLVASQEIVVGGAGPAGAHDPGEHERAGHADQDGEEQGRTDAAAEQGAHPQPHRPSAARPHDAMMACATGLR